MAIEYTCDRCKKKIEEYGIKNVTQGKQLNTLTFNNIHTNYYCYDCYDKIIICLKS